MYESTLKHEATYDFLEYSIVYKSDKWSNNFDLEKQCYIANGSIIKYKLSKQYVNEPSELNEKYFICPGSYSDGYTRYYNFIELDENLFKLFMTGNITIEELLEQNKSIIENKQKIK